MRDRYHAFWRLDESIKVLSPRPDFTGCGVLVTPALFLTDDDTAARVRAHAEAGGGTVVVSFLSGIVDQREPSRSPSTTAGPAPSGPSSRG